MTLVPDVNTQQPVECVDQIRGQPQAGVLCNAQPVEDKEFTVAPRIRNRFHDAGPAACRKQPVIMEGEDPFEVLRRRGVENAIGQTRGRGIAQGALQCREIEERFLDGAGTALSFPFVLRSSTCDLRPATEN